MKYKLRNPFYKIEEIVETTNLFAMSIGEHDEYYNEGADTLILIEVTEGVFQYRRFHEPTFKGLNIRFGSMFKMTIKASPTSTHIEFKPIKNRVKEIEFVDYHWEHID